MKKNKYSTIFIFILFIYLSFIPTVKYVYRNIKCNQLISKEVINQVDLDLISENFEKLKKIGYEYTIVYNYKEEKDSFIWKLNGNKSHSGAIIQVGPGIQPTSPTGTKVPNSNTRYEFSNYYDVDYLWDFKWEHDSPSFMIYNENACIDMDYGDPNRDWEQDLLDIMEAVKEE